MAIIINDGNPEKLLKDFISGLGDDTWKYDNGRFIHTTPNHQWEECYFKASTTKGQLIFTLYPKTNDVYHSGAFGFLHGRLSGQLMNLLGGEDLTIS